jgi:hypothetical protein
LQTDGNEITPKMCFPPVLCIGDSHVPQGDELIASLVQVIDKPTLVAHEVRAFNLVRRRVDNDRDFRFVDLKHMVKHMTHQPPCGVALLLKYRDSLGGPLISSVESSSHSNEESHLSD